MDSFIDIDSSLKFIEENLKENIKLKDLARKAYLSEFHFHRLFTSVTGESVMEYVRNKRLKKAAADLVNTNKKIIDIAFEYQFNSSESFTRAFKRNYSMSPRHYRTQYQNNNTISLKSNENFNKKSYHSYLKLSA